MSSSLKTPMLHDAEVGAVEPAMALPVVESHAVAHPIAVPQAPAGAWTTGPFGCCEDCCTCCTVWCLPCIPLAQIYTQFSPGSPVLRARKCKIVATALIVLFCVYEALATGHIFSYEFPWVPCLEANATSAHCHKELIEGHLATSIASLLGLLFFLSSCFIVFSARSKIRKAEAIPPSCCGNNEDCCCAFWCNPCTTCQIMRHLLTSAPTVVNPATNQLYKPHYDLCAPTITKPSAVALPTQPVV